MRKKIINGGKRRMGEDMLKKVMEHPQLKIDLAFHKRHPSFLSMFFKKFYRDYWRIKNKSEKQMEE